MHVDDDVRSIYWLLATAFTLSHSLTIFFFFVRFAVISMTPRVSGSFLFAYYNFRDLSFKIRKKRQLHQRSLIIICLRNAALFVDSPLQYSIYLHSLEMLKSEQCQAPPIYGFFFQSPFATIRRDASFLTLMRWHVPLLQIGAVCETTKHAPINGTNEKQRTTIAFYWYAVN